MERNETQKEKGNAMNAEKLFEVGNVVEFVYANKNGMRIVRIDKVETGVAFGGIIGPVTRSITGWDFTADAPVGGYRTFLVEKMKFVGISNPE